MIISDGEYIYFECIDYCTESGEYIGNDKLYQVDWQTFLCWHCLREYEAMWEEDYEMFGVTL